MKRGVVLPLTREQIVTRALYLCGKRPLSALDEHVRQDPIELHSLGYKYTSPFDPTQLTCPDLYYLLQDHNGGKDPRAPDPADRWSAPGKTFQNRTVDCSGGNAWMHGFDRYQPERFAHLYDGYINTDSKILDATGARRCFRPLPRPEPGCIITCMSGSPGHKVGHEGCVVAVHALEWDPTVKACWGLVDVVDCAKRDPNPTNRMTTALGWFGTQAYFLESVMEPD